MQGGKPITNIIFIGGNIGAGKSTLLREVKEKNLLGRPEDVFFVPEQPTEWLKQLDIYYRELQLISDELFTNLCLNGTEKTKPFIETDLGNTLYKIQEKIYDIWDNILLQIGELYLTGDLPKFVVFERSPLESQKIFIQAGSFLLSRGQYTALLIKSQALIETFAAFGTTRYFMLDVKYEECQRRVHKRKCEWDKFLFPEYIRLLDIYYKNWFYEMFTKYKNKGAVCKLQEKAVAGMFAVWAKTTDPKEAAFEIIVAVVDDGLIVVL